MTEDKSSLPAIRTVGVVGCGLMGSGIAQVCAQSGYRTIVREVDDATVSKGLERIESFLSQGVARGVRGEDDRAGCFLDDRPEGHIRIFPELVMQQFQSRQGHQRRPGEVGRNLRDGLLRQYA